MHQTLGAIYLEQDKFTEARSAFDRELDLLDCLSSCSDNDLPAIWVPGKGPLTPKQIRALIGRARALTHYNLACLHAKTSDTPKALESLRRSIESGFTNRDKIQREADFANLREHPTYHAILASLGPN